ncbi:MAG: hypothetical protein M3O22_03340 [Pseudomonadota bacterium]|nr:hypothetical protein [Pseudomonadota bacterium]
MILTHKFRIPARTLKRHILGVFRKALFSQPSRSLLTGYFDISLGRVVMGQPCPVHSRTLHHAHLQADRTCRGLSGSCHLSS